MPSDAVNRISCPKIVKSEGRSPLGWSSDPPSFELLYPGHVPAGSTGVHFYPSLSTASSRQPPKPERSLKAPAMGSNPHAPQIECSSAASGRREPTELATRQHASSV